MPKTLDDLLPLLKRRLQREGPPGIVEALDEYFSSVAAELEVLRKKAHVTQRELASRSGIHQAEVSRILSGRTQPRVVSTSGRVRRRSNKKKSR